MAARNGALLGVIVFGLLGVARGAEATLITYTLSTSGAGQLDGVSFSARVITLTGSADTVDIDPLPPCCFRNLLSLSFSIDGVGSGTFLDVIQVVSNQSLSSAGFGDVSQSQAIFFVNAPVFASYDLSTPVGPINGILERHNDFYAPTSAGTLMIRGSSSLGSGSFVATAVPEPSTAVMFGMGLAGFGVIARRRPGKEGVAA